MQQVSDLDGVFEGQGRFFRQRIAFFIFMPISAEIAQREQSKIYQSSTPAKPASYPPFRDQTTTKPAIPVELNLIVARQKYKQSVSSDIVEGLRRCSENPEIQALALKIELCNSNDNLVVATDLHNSDGECFNGKTILARCNSRFCQQCVSFLGASNRREMNKAVKEMKLFVGESWFQPTFTMPDKCFDGVRPDKIKMVMDDAWQSFTHCETRKTKSNTWYQSHFRGGFKNAEFTYKDSYHFHIHALMIGKAKIQRDRCFWLRYHWTRALKKSFAKHSIPFECKTGNRYFIPAFVWWLIAAKIKASSLFTASLFVLAMFESQFTGLANVHLQKLDSSNRQDAIRELSKYLTVSKSWLEIPQKDLEMIALMPSFGRMFEKFGDVRAFLREEKDKRHLSPTERLETEEGAYLDTQNLMSDQELGSLRKNWRVRCREVTFEQFRIELLEQIQIARDFRKRQLKLKFPGAEFWTLDHRRF